MSAHRAFEDLTVGAMDAALSPQQEDALHRHLAECAECRAVADAYRADQRRLRAIAFEPAPAWIRSAIFDRPTRARTTRPAWTVAVAALALLATLLSIAVGATLQRPGLSVVPIGPIGWLTPADTTRLVGGASVDGGWLVAVADESLTATELRIYRPGTGWNPDGEFDRFAAGAGAVVQVGPQSSELNTFAYSINRGTVLTRDKSGVWARHDLDATRLILDVAVHGKDVWVLAEPAGPLDASESRLSLLSSGTGFSMAVGPSEVRVTGVRLAASADRLAVAGCSTRARWMRTRHLQLHARRSRVDEGGSPARRRSPHPHR